MSKRQNRIEEFAIIGLQKKKLVMIFRIGILAGASHLLGAGLADAFLTAITDGLPQTVGPSW